jgi:hypothetical protein
VSAPEQNGPGEETGPGGGGWPSFAGPVAAAFVGGLLIAAVAVAAEPEEHHVIRSHAPAPISDLPEKVMPEPIVVPDDSGIPGVVAWETRGWPAGTGPAVPGALPHDHHDGPIRYAVTPPAGGDHNSKWVNCGVYDEPLPSERVGHDLEHGVVWITWRPDLPRKDVAELERFVRRQPMVVVRKGPVVTETNERYIVMSPFPGLPAPIVLSSWAHQLRVESPDDPRMQRFVDTFRMNPEYSPEYGPTCEQQPEAIGGRPAFR